MVAQQPGGFCQVTAAGVFQMEADQIDDAVFGALQLGAQKLGAKVTCNLHHAFGRAGLDFIQFLRVNDAVLHAIYQRFLKKRACVKQGN